MDESELFQAALKLSSAERAEFLEAQCGGNPQRRQAVESLLQAHFDASGLLKEDRRDGAQATQALESVDPLAGIVIADRYKLLQQIGEGGMGTVWLAEQFAPVQRKVAIKLVKAGVNSKTVLARFDAERQALALMDHPNIARIFDGGITPQGQPYFVMEYVKGTTLTEYCDAARLPLAERLQLFLMVCQAIQHAHQKGVIHRDLKPSNILACPYDGRPIPKIIDFGLAKALHQPLTELTVFTAHGAMMGTPMYMSPEQAEQNNLDVDTRSDIYSLGVILYELLTGTTPLEKQQLQKAALHEVLRWIKEVEPPKPSTRLTTCASLPSIAAQRNVEPAQLRRSVDGDLDWIVMKSLEKARERRYGSVGAFARDIERFLNDEMVEARPPSSAYRFTRFARKHRFGLGVTAAVTLLLLISTVVTGWQYMKIRNSTAAAVAALQAAENSRQEALTSQRSALDQLKSSRAVLQFLEQDLLAQAVSGNAQASGFQPDPNVRLRTAIDRAAERIGERFSGQSHPEMLVRLALGVAYQGLGIYPVARDQLQQAWVLALRNPELDRDAYIRIAFSLATVLINMNKIAEAQATLAQALDGKKDWQGDDAQLGTDELTSLLATLRQPIFTPELAAAKTTDSPANGDSTSAQLERLINSQPDERTRETLRKSFSGMAEFFELEQQGKTQEAEALLETTMQSLKGQQQAGLQEIAKGMSAASAGKMEEALKRVRSGRTQLEQELGMDHPSVGLAALSQGAVELELAMFAEAEASCREALRIGTLTQSILIPVQDCQTVLARALMAQNRLDEAESLLWTAIGADQPPPPESLPAIGAADSMDLTIDPIAALVDLYRAQGKTELADRWQAARRK